MSLSKWGDRVEAKLAQEPEPDPVPLTLSEQISDLAAFDELQEQAKHIATYVVTRIWSEFPDIQLRIAWEEDYFGFALSTAYMTRVPMATYNQMTREAWLNGFIRMRDEDIVENTKSARAWTRYLDKVVTDLSVQLHRSRASQSPPPPTSTSTATGMIHTWTSGNTTGSSYVTGQTYGLRAPSRVGHEELELVYQGRYGLNYVWMCGKYLKLGPNPDEEQAALESIRQAISGGDETTTTE